MRNMTGIVQTQYVAPTAWSGLKTEVLRKSLHFTIALVPSLASRNFSLAVTVLSSGILFYTYAELLRLRGYRLAIISSVTVLASRERDRGGIVLGPVTLGLGALMALALYPSQAASIAIYALAFGDGLSSLVGRAFGSIRLPHTGGKTLEGSMACFFAVLSVSYSVSYSLPRSCIIAAFASFIEALPLKDSDNIAIPVGTGLVAVLILGWV